MSMVLYLRRISDSELKDLKSRQEAAPSAPEPVEKKGLFSKLFSGSASTQMPQLPSGDPVQEFFSSGMASEDVIDFDRSWDALNFMLTGEAFGNEGALAIFYHQGEEIGPDSGYGPARYIPSAKMKEFNAALSDLRDEQLAARFDPAAFDAGQIYASYLFTEDGIEVDYIMQWVPNLRKFANKCAETNSGALVAIY